MHKLKRLLSIDILILLLIPIIGLVVTFSPLKNLVSVKERISSPSSSSNAKDVLGRYTQVPQIYISGGDQGYSGGGMIALASTDEPAVVIGGYNINGEAEITMYEANETTLLAYLTHDADGKQTKKPSDVDQFRYVTKVKHSINGDSYEGSKVPLPFGQTGIWYLKVKIGSKNADAFVLRSNIGVLTKEGDNEFIFWGQNFKNKRSISEGTIKVLNLQDTQKELQSVSFNSDGIAKANINAQADIALVQQKNDLAIVPLNLKYLNAGHNYSQFFPKERHTKYFIFTDRPLYKPGDTVNFKAVLRDDDDARYTIPDGDAVVKIYNGYFYEGSKDQPEFEKSFKISPDGTLSGQYKIPTSVKVGNYSLSVNMPIQKATTAYWTAEYYANTIYYDVEYYKKPEFSIDVTTTKTELIAGDKGSFKISGSYFSGQPMLGQKVKYSVYSSDFYEYQYLADRSSYSQNITNEYQYGYNPGYGNNKVTEGTATLNTNGDAEITFDSKMNFNKGKSQIFSIEATIDDGSLTPSFSRRNMLVYAGEYGIYRKDTTSGTKINTPLVLPVTLIPYKNKPDLSGRNLTAKVHRTEWVSYQEKYSKYPSTKKIEEELPSLSAKTDKSGNAEITFTPTKTGSYSITVESKDARNNLIAKEFYSYVSELDQPEYTEEGSKDITITTDKQKYLPTDTVHFSLFSQIPDRDIFLSLERGRVNRYQIVHMKGKNGLVDVPLVNTDIPNMYAMTESFSNSTLDSNQTNVIVSPDSKKLLVNISPNSKTFGPGETVRVNVTTKDTSGKPVPAELALWTVDKAIFELSDNKLGNIFDTFWEQRGDLTSEAHSLEGILAIMSEGGGCFASGTEVLMADGKTKSIEDVHAGDMVLSRRERDASLVKAKVLKTHTADVSGYLIVNGNLKVTANHILWVNNKWMEAGSVQIGDLLTDKNGKHVTVESIEWQSGKFAVYNLEIEKYHTYFANGIWVHNDKGVERNAFKDTAYWNPSIHTDASGKAKVTFTLPDNLTTWTIAAVAATTDTRVGQTTSEIIVTKDVIVRPILPNIMRTGDEIIVSAMVQNFTEQDQSFAVDLKFDSGDVEQATQPDVFIKSNGLKQLYWKIKPTIERSKAKLVFGARAKDNKKLADVVTQEIPVRAFGFEEKRAESGEGEKTFSVKIAADSLREKSKITLSLSQTMIGTLPTAMKYLIGYPYGCVEQTTSKFVPAVIAKVNQGLFAESLKDKKIDDILQKGILRLATLQKNDGGWTWWFSGDSDPYITAYVVEYLQQAKQAGVKVDNSLLENAQTYLEQKTYVDPQTNQEKQYKEDEMVSKTYGLSVLGIKGNLITDFDNLSPDFLALTVMANYRNGGTNPQTNGLNKLTSLAKSQGDAVFWEAGNKVNFGSKDASTALAIRAIILAGGDHNLAVKAARYLTRVRQSDYWSNTYATAQVIRGLVELSKIGDELQPHYTYAVKLDGKQIMQGTVTNTKQILKEIDIPVKSIKSGGSNLAITKSGDGQIYSTLAINGFHTDKKTQSVNRGLLVKREYINEKGEQYSLGVGDTVIVKLTVGGLSANEYYGVINDELPSGLVPINPIFKNEQYGSDPSTYYTSYDVSDREITENGMVMSLYQIAAGEKTYSYKARVVSQGSFIVPPATASLMYAPELYGRSDVQTLTIAKASEAVGVKNLTKTFSENLGLTAIWVLIIIVFSFLILREKGVTATIVKEKFNNLFKKDTSKSQKDASQTPESKQ